MYNSPRLTAEAADCSLPMTFDQYSACSYRCAYCFSVYSGRGMACATESEYQGRSVQSVSVPRVKRLFTQPHGFFKPLIEDRVVLQWGGLSDPFCSHEQRLGVGLDLLRFFKDIDYPLSISTKGAWWTKDDRYRDLFRGQANWNVKVSIITLDPVAARVVERGAPSPRQRLAAIEEVAKLGAGGATLRLRPYIPGVSDGTYEQLIRDAASAGATAVSTEFFCVEDRSRVGKERLGAISAQAGFDLYRFYKKNSAGCGYMRLSRNAKQAVFGRMHQLCDELGLRFYVSDAHFKELSANGCCCGLPESWNYSRGQWTHALLLAREHGTVRWSDFEEGLRFAKGMMAGRGFINGNSEKRCRFVQTTVYDYIRWLWNSPSKASSPYRCFEGALVPGETDDNGNLVYHYNEDLLCG